MAVRGQWLRLEVLSGGCLLLFAVTAVLGNTICSLDAPLLRYFKAPRYPLQLSHDPLHVKDVSHMQGSTAWGCQW
jgi:hypothetical protein